MHELRRCSYAFVGFLVVEEPQLKHFLFLFFARLHDDKSTKS